MWNIPAVIAWCVSRWLLFPECAWFKTRALKKLHISYRKTSSRGAYGHSVFEEYPLDSTRSDSTMSLSIIYSSAVVISVVVESSRCSSKTLKKDHVHMPLWTRLFGMTCGLRCVYAVADPEGGPADASPKFWSTLYFFCKFPIL